MFRLSPAAVSLLVPFGCTSETDTAEAPLVCGEAIDLGANDVALDIRIEVVGENLLPSGTNYLYRVQIGGGDAEAAEIMGLDECVRVVVRPPDSQRVLVTAEAYGEPDESGDAPGCYGWIALEPAPIGVVTAVSVPVACSVPCCPEE